MKSKLKMARKMMTAVERKNNVPPFLTEAWNQRSKDIKYRVSMKQLDTHLRAVKRKEKLKEHKKCNRVNKKKLIKK